jgi:hypothetical protein
MSNSLLIITRSDTEDESPKKKLNVQLENLNLNKENTLLETNLNLEECSILFNSANNNKLKILSYIKKKGPNS